MLINRPTAVPCFASVTPRTVGFSHTEETEGKVLKFPYSRLHEVHGGLLKPYKDLPNFTYFVIPPEKDKQNTGIYILSGEQGKQYTEQHAFIKEERRKNRRPISQDYNKFKRIYTHKPNYEEASSMMAKLNKDTDKRKDEHEDYYENQLKELKNSFIMQAESIE